MSKKIRFGMMGAGFIANLNGGTLLAQEAVELVAIANPTVSKAERLRDNLGVSCALYGSYDDMLANEQLDAVMINLPHHLHKDAFIKSAEHGLDIIIEKALANTYSECLDMIEAANLNGVRATVCHTQRYNAVFQEAAGFIAGHDLGRLLSVHDNIHMHYFWDGRSPWQLSNELSGGGIALNYGVHQLDRVHFFLNQKTVELHAKYLAEKPGYSVPSSYAMMGIGEHGTAYTINCTGYSGPRINDMLLVFENGILHCVLCDNGEQKYGLWFGDNASGEFKAQPFTLSTDDSQMYHRQFKAAVDYLSGETDEAPIPLSWAAEMVRLVEIGF